MRLTNDSTPVVAPTTTGAEEKLADGISTANATPKPIALHLPHKHAGHLITWGNCNLAPQSTRSLFVDAAEYLDLRDEGRPAQLCPECVGAKIAHAEAEQRKREEQLRLQQAVERASRRQAREAEMHYELVDAYRAGDTETVKKLLDAFLAEDDATLAKLGISAWDELNADE
ncbi:hypothetical protein JKI95_09205 [Corynebacterium aquatimens]|uniref:hypothetical protein n=1 Tax=Corynebacterium TaxID=1716 RepID=UPI001F417990|nr:MULTISPECIES: hypothetical protein [Corynebacterium]QYH19312.1 hypothetical protein JKI95_09205 [Corynebacterium aquatimens]UIZ91791.1 hypothetical protein JZY91_08685 [Corynebacterium sp. CNCTC7651]